MRTSVVISALVATGLLAVIDARPAAAGGAESYGPPQPYEFNYSAEDPEGSHSHSQSSDGTTVRGHYTIQLADGTMRKVEYHADEKGFHAKIVTNELGTESKNPADVIFESSAPTGEEAAKSGGSGSAKSGYSGRSKAAFGGASAGGASNSDWN